MNLIFVGNYSNLIWIFCQFFLLVVLLDFNSDNVNQLWKDKMWNVKYLKHIVLRLTLHYRTLKLKLIIENWIENYSLVFKSSVQTKYKSSIFNSNEYIYWKMTVVLNWRTKITLNRTLLLFVIVWFRENYIMIPG